MIGNGSTSTKVDGTGYTLEYAVMENQGEEEPGGIVEYGIRCALLSENMTVTEVELKNISLNYGFVCQLVEKLQRNQVFPVHVRDVIEDLLFVEYEVKGA